MRQFRRARHELVVEIIGLLDRDFQEIALARYAIMYRSGSEQMAHIVKLVVTMIRPIFLVVAQLHRRADIAVAFLRRRDHIDQRVQVIEDRLLLGDAVYVRAGFHVFVAIAIAPHGALALVILKSGGDIEIAEDSAIFRLVERFAHAGQNLFAT